jgi:hypothetical protein
MSHLVVESEEREELVFIYFPILRYEDKEEDTLGDVVKEEENSFAHTLFLSNFDMKMSFLFDNISSSFHANFAMSEPATQFSEFACESCGERKVGRAERECWNVWNEQVRGTGTRGGESGAKEHLGLRHPLFHIFELCPVVHEHDCQFFVLTLASNHNWREFVSILYIHLHPSVKKQLRDSTSLHQDRNTAELIRIARAAHERCLTLVGSVVNFSTSLDQQFNHLELHVAL